MATVWTNPLTSASLIWPLQSSVDTVDWTVAEKIDPQYIASVRSQITETFPKRESQLTPYPLKDLEGLVSIDRNGYNPFDLRLPYSLRNMDELFDWRSISDPWSPEKLTRKQAAEQYLNFVKEYNLLYADILDAINECEEAKSRIQEKLTTPLMYENAGINPKHLARSYSENPASESFRRTCLAYLAIDVLRSPEKGIRTAARARVLQLLYDYDIDAIASSFSQSSLGFMLPYEQEHEPVEDLIPRAFMKRPEEKGGTPHNGLFYQNAKIQEIFEIRRGYGDPSSRMNPDDGVSRLIQEYPAQTIQTLLSIMRLYDTDRQTRMLVFHMLAGLSKLDGLQKGDLFGVKASYRVDGQDTEVSGLQSRVGATTGTGPAFGDDGLDSLSPAELLVRLRQTLRYLELMDSLLAKRAVYTGAPTSAAQFADHQGYFKTLGLHPETPPDEFDPLLGACYRVQAKKWHTDRKDGNKRQMQKVNEALEKLRDPDTRGRYLAGEFV